MFKQKYICSLDLGAREIKAGIFSISVDGDFQWECTHAQTIHGFKEGYVSDLGEFSECIYQAVYAVSKKTGIKIKEIILGLNGNMVTGRNINAAISLVEKGRKVIMQRDIRLITKQARLLGTHMDEDIIHDIPQFYKVDDDQLVSNPQGLCGRKLEVKALILGAQADRLSSITKAVNQAGFDVEDMVLSAYTAETMLLTEEQKNRGCVLIDIGATVSSFLIFKGGCLQYYTTLAQGGGGFTYSIAQKLNFSFDVAEEIKKSYASVTSMSSYHKEEILIKKDQSYIPIKREVIDHSLEEEICLFEKSIQEALVASGLQEEISEGIFMTGGGALLPGLIDRLDQHMPFSVQLGKIKRGVPQEIQDVALFVPVAGVAYYGLRKNMFGVESVTNQSAHWFKRSMHYVGDLYEEYF
ncbi:hypothetical protein MNBD_UNCLBAC01-104 [hydrothermal vent metagenome]|uniref:SHS2 domain-containing protein n=1 Tax=hydrothermal vent metagenome TaxID=652676 RepID=A0A3B1CZE8_9ZZZZ